ncbi:MAG: hypothetical protein AAFY98_06405 [Verrucomicrobiota bacterium]
MIEFSKTGPLAHNPFHTTLPLLIGVGQAGISVIDEIRLRHEWIPGRMYAVDTDLQAIRGSVATEKFLIGKERFYGMGSLGDRHEVTRAVQDQMDDLVEMFDAGDWALVVCGLGGTVGSAATPEIVNALKNRGIQIVVQAMLPFQFESQERQDAAREARARLEAEADLVFVTANDRLLGDCTPSDDLRELIHLHHQEVACSLVDFCRLLVEGGMIQLSLEDCQERVVALARGSRSTENTWMSHTSDRGENVERLIEDALDGIQFHDGRVWEKADSMIVGLVGGADLSMDRSQDILRTLRNRLPDGLDFLPGVLVDNRLEAELRLTLIATQSTAEFADTVVSELDEKSFTYPEDAETERLDDVNPESAKGIEEYNQAGIDHEEINLGEEVVSDADSIYEQDFLLPQHGTPQRYFSEQEELPLDRKADRGRFEKTDPTTINGQDLDQPTFQRMGMKIRL